MLADPRRIRLLLAGGIILVAAVILRLVAGAPAQPPGAAPATAPTSSQQTDTTERSDDQPSGVSSEADDVDLDAAHDVAADFAAQYLSWPAGGSLADRAERIAAHSTARFAAQVAEAHDTGAADVDDRDDGWAQTVEVIATQTATARPRHVEVTVMTEVAVDEDGEKRTVPTNLTVVVREEAGTWLVDDLR